MKTLYMVVRYDMGLGKHYQTGRLAATGSRAIVYWYLRRCLLVREFLFTDRRVIVYRYASHCLLVPEPLFTGTGVLVY
jgi:hypothetical protein